MAPKTIVAAVLFAACAGHRVVAQGSAAAAASAAPSIPSWAGFDPTGYSGLHSTLLSRRDACVLAVYIDVASKRLSRVPPRRHNAMCRIGIAYCIIALLDCLSIYDTKCPSMLRGCSSVYRRVQRHPEPAVRVHAHGLRVQGQQRCWRHLQRAPGPGRWCALRPRTLPAGRSPAA